MSDGGSCVWEAGRVDTRSPNHPVPAFQPRGRGLPGRRSYGPIFPYAHIPRGTIAIPRSGSILGIFEPQTSQKTWVKNLASGSL